MTLPRIAFLGTGLMGAPMAANLLKGGYSLTAWNRTAAKAEKLKPLGAVVAASAAQAAQNATIAITMLENAAVVEAVLFGETGAAASLAADGLVIDCSSIEPKASRAHAERLAGLGLRYLDAPVSGGTVGAEEASLAIMIGGEARDFERVKPVLEKMGRPTHVGPVGCGQLAKLCNQAIVAVTVGAVAEALLLAAAGGADPAAVREALMGGFADSRVLRFQAERMLDRNFIPGGPARLLLKDGNNIRAVARDCGLHLPLTDRATALFESLVDHGGENYDHIAILLELERMNGGKRVGTKPDRLPS